MVKPIFVIGRDRSGTKWLSNIIANHKEVACVQHEDHSGILEASDVLVAMPIVFGNISVPENFIAFLESFAETDFFRVTGLNKDYFYKSRPADYLSFFKELMDRFAEREGKSYWIQKGGVTSLRDLYEYYPDIKFIIIIRNVEDNVRSKIGQRMLFHGKDQKKHILSEMVKYYIDMEQIRKYKDRHNVYILHYEELKKRKQPIVENLCKYLQIEFDEAMLTDNFRKNTSFRKGVARDDILTRSDVLIMDLLSVVLKRLPGWLYEYLSSIRMNRIKKNFFNTKGKKFISYKLKKKELNWEQN